MPYSCQSNTLSAVGVTPWMPVLINGEPCLPPAVLVGLTTGATMTYSVEVTGNSLDGLVANGFDGMTGLTASANGTLAGSLPYVRLHITAYTNGSATIQLITPT